LRRFLYSEKPPLKKENKFGFGDLAKLAGQEQEKKLSKK